LKLKQNTTTPDDGGRPGVVILKVCGFPHLLEGKCRGHPAKGRRRNGLTRLRWSPRGEDWIQIHLTSPRPGRVPSQRAHLSPHWFGTTPLVGSGSEDHPHLKRGLPSVKPTPLRGKEGDGCPSLSPTSLVELGRGVVIISKNRLDEGVFKMRGCPSRWRLSTPLTPSFCNAAMDILRDLKPGLNRGTEVPFI